MSPHHREGWTHSIAVHSGVKSWCGIILFVRKTGDWDGVSLMKRYGAGVPGAGVADVSHVLGSRTALTTSTGSEAHLGCVCANPFDCVVRVSYRE